MHKKYKPLLWLLLAVLCFAVSFIRHQYLKHTHSPKYVQEQLQQYLKEQELSFNSLIKDTVLLHQFIEGKTTAKHNTVYGFFIFDADHKPVFWNSNQFYIDEKDIDGKENNVVVHYSNGEFLLERKTLQLNHNNYFIVGLIPIRWKYFIENNYLQERFQVSNSVHSYFEIGADTIFNPLRNTSGKAICSIKAKPYSESNLYNDFIEISFKFIALFFLILAVQSTARRIAERYSFFIGFIFFAGITILLRTCTYLFPAIIDIKKTGLFDPSVYASNFLHPSLGDLMINTLLLLCVILYYNLHVSRRDNNTQNKFSIIQTLFSIAGIAITAFGIVEIIQSLLLDSKISFDVANFGSLNIYSVCGFIQLGLLIWCFALTSVLFYRKVLQNNTKFILQLLILLFIIFLILFVGQLFHQTIYLAAAIWLCVYFCLLYLCKQKIISNNSTASFILIGGTYFAISIAFLVLSESKLLELEQRKKIAERLVLKSDPSSEILLNIAVSTIDENYLKANYKNLLQKNTNKQIKDSIITLNFSGYLNKYDTRIYMYDSLHQPLFNEDSASYANIIDDNRDLTDVEGAFNFKTNATETAYIFEQTLKNADGKEQLSFIVVAKPKAFKNDAIFPELFRQSQTASADAHANYFYAVYKNGNVINHFGNYYFSGQTAINNNVANTFIETNENGYSILKYYANNNAEAIVVKANTNWLEIVTTTVYMCFSFFFLYFLYLLMANLLKGRLQLKHIKQYLNWNIQTQMQAIVIFKGVFSILMIAIATTIFFTARFKKSSEEKMFKSLQMIADNIQNAIANNLNIDTIVGFNNVERKMDELSEIYNVELNYFGTDGHLIFSTQPYIYSKHLLSYQMHPTAFQMLKQNKAVQFAQEESIGLMKYLGLYIPIKDNAGNTSGYINIPYLNAQAELKSEITGITATLINFNVIILLIASAIAYWFAGRLTRTLRLIGEKMRQTNLQKTNETLVWNKNDEIGVLINEYNNMVQQLEFSAKTLAAKEREGAWREMAQQIAHEIKNPLTPMKLSIQHLQNSIQKNAPNVQELSKRVAATLIEQIDQLASIAGDFSQFANIGNAKPEKLLINEILLQALELYTSEIAIEAKLIATEDLYVFADKLQLNRLFGNLVKNAVEASKDANAPTILVKADAANQMILISIQDNGSGISQAVQSKIFTPNFTTKSSGTGLGLAICRGIVENINGRIWFETEENVGSIFFVELHQWNESL